MLKVYFRAFAIVAWIGACALILRMMLFLRFPKSLRQSLIQRCYAGIARILQLRIRITGALANQRPLLLVTNHSSYLDIIVLGAAARVHFAPKADIAAWPVIGAICRMTESVFIDRRVNKTRQNITALQSALMSGQVVALFPEGTTSDGKRVLPFKSSYFTLVEQDAMAGLAIQPATITYYNIHGLPVGNVSRPKLAWYGDMELLPHLKELLHSGPIGVGIEYHAPVAKDEFNSRKDIANKCFEVVSNALHNLP